MGGLSRKEEIMERRLVHPKSKLSEVFTIRKLAKSGNSRYLSVSKLIPSDWQAVKVFVEKLEGGVCVLRLEQIK